MPPFRRLFLTLLAAAIVPSAQAQSPGGKTLEQSLAQLGDRDPARRREAAVALGSQGPDLTKAAIQALSQSLRDPEVSVRHATALSLGNLGPASKVALPAIRAAVSDESAVVRRAAIFAMGNMGADAKAGVGELAKRSATRMRRSATPRPTRWEASARRRRSPPRRSARRSRPTATPTSARRRRSRSARSAATPRTPCPRSSRRSATPIPALRRATIEAIGAMGPEAKPAVAALSKVLLEDQDFVLRRSAAFALGEIGAEARAAAGPLGRALQDGDPSVRYDAAQSLSVIGPDAKAAVPELALRPEGRGHRGSQEGGLRPRRDRPERVGRRRGAGTGTRRRGRGCPQGRRIRARGDRSGREARACRSRQGARRPGRQRCAWPSPTPWARSARRAAESSPRSSRSSRPTTTTRSAKRPPSPSARWTPRWPSRPFRRLAGPFGGRPPGRAGGHRQDGRRRRRGRPRPPRRARRQEEGRPAPTVTSGPRRSHANLPSGRSRFGCWFLW